MWNKLTQLQAIAQPALGLAAILGAAAAQYLHVYRQADRAALGLLVAAVGLWLFALARAEISVGSRLSAHALAEDREASRREIAKHPVGKPHSPARVFVVSAFALAMLTFLFSGGNEFTPDNVLAWCLSIGVFLYAFWVPEKTWDDWRAWFGAHMAASRQVLARGACISPWMLALIGVTLFGGVIYYHDLDATPAEMDSDHAEKLLDVNDIVNNGLAPIYFERNMGREPMQFYLTAAFVNLTQHPIDHMALKLLTALAGVLVIPLTFLFARELFDDDVALFAALLVAIGKWPLTIARMGLRFPFAPLFLIPTMLFLLRALKSGRRNDFLMAGLFLGLGLLGYNAFRFVPVLVMVWLILGWLTRRMSIAQTVRYVENSGLMFLLAVFVAMPLLRYTIEKPEMVWYYEARSWVGEGQSSPSELLGVLAQNSVRAAQMFNWTSDSAWHASLPGDPALDYVSGGLFILGVAYALYRWVRLRESKFALVLLGIGVMLLPSVQSLAFPNENPSVVRASGAIPLVFVVAALPLAWLGRTLRTSLARFAWGGVAVAAIFILLFAVSLRANYLRYFRDFDANYRLASWNSSEVAAVIRGFADSVGDIDHAWILLYPHWIDTRNVAINMRRIGWEHTLPSAEGAQAQLNDPANKLYILNPDDHANLSRLLELFPNAQQRVLHARTPGHDFVILYVPGQVGTGEFLGSR